MGNLTRNQVRQANKTYKQDHPWDAYLDLIQQREDGHFASHVWRKKKVVVHAKSRAEAFDKLHTQEIKYNQTHKKTKVVSKGVAQAPRLSR